MFNVSVFQSAAELTMYQLDIEKNQHFRTIN